MHASKACRFRQKKAVEGDPRDNQENQENQKNQESKKVLVFCVFTLVSYFFNGEHLACSTGLHFHPDDLSETPLSA